MVEELEPPLFALIMAPFRLVKRFFRWLLSKLPITDYMLDQYERDSREVAEEMENSMRSTKEIERRIKEIEKELD